MLHADADLAARLERLIALECRAFVEAARRAVPEAQPELLDVAGGVAMYVGPGSPVNQASGCGFAGPVSAEELDALEDFYRRRGARPVANVCPLADASLAQGLSARGWTVDGFENVLACEIDEGEGFGTLPEGVEIREVASEHERALWAQLVADGFSAPDDPTEPQLRLGRIASHRAGARLLLAFADGRPAGTGELVIEDGVGWLSADTTLPRFRRRGVQRAMQEARIALARDAGCTLAVTESAPGSGSQRNMERLGFRIVYTRVDLIAPEPV